jgi:Winged helix DNA-binding domain
MRYQRLTGDPGKTPEEVVRLLGAVQSQDFGPGKWSIAQRTGGVTNADLDQAFAAGTILRTHVLRPTWHFVLPADIRWMQELTALRVHALNSGFYRNHELDEAVLERCTTAIIGALEGGQHLTRKEIGAVLDRAGIATNPLRLIGVVMNLELNGFVCSGAPQGKQQTYALLDERAPQAKRLTREEALAELTLRYFTGHGPATARDFSWWSNLTMAGIERGLEMVGSSLQREVIDGLIYWFPESSSPSTPASPSVHLLQGYDEYIVGYGETKYVVDESGLARSLPRPRGIYTNAIILDGQVAGQWKPVMKKNAVTINVTVFTPFGEVQSRALSAAAERYGKFLGLPVTLTTSG